MKLDCTEEVVPDSNSTSIGSEFGISYEGPLREEARETFYEVHGRFPTNAELDKYISTGREASDFYKIRNACLV